MSPNIELAWAKFAASLTFGLAASCKSEDIEDGMLAGWYEKNGPAEKVIEVGEMGTPHPGPSEVLVRLRASGINPSDYKKRAVNAPLEFPRIVPHSDGAGVVVKRFRNC